MKTTKKKGRRRRPRANVYEIVTKAIIAKLDEGTIPWRKPWDPTVGLPRNLSSNRAYRGMNLWVLSAQGYSSPFWLTFRQAKALGGSVMKGEKSTPVVFWKAGRREVENGETGEPEEKGYLLVRYYNIFNLEQTEGVRIPKGRIPEEGGEPEREELPDCEVIASRYLDDGGPSLDHGGGKACYVPPLDAVKMPVPVSFDSSPAYWATLFHELGHSTGAKSRLDRPGVAEMDGFGSHRYADEELVAEFCSSFLCGVAGIDREDEMENSAAYIAHWREKLTEDPKVVVYAAQRAQKAADLILGESTDTKTEDEDTED